MSKVNSFIKFAISLVYLLAIFFANFSQLLYILIIILFVVIIYQVKIKPTIKFLSLGLFIAIFTFLIEYSQTDILRIAFKSGFIVFFRYFLFIQISFLFNKFTTNKEKAYIFIYPLTKINLKFMKYFIYLNFIFQELTSLEQRVTSLRKYQRHLLKRTSKLVMYKDDLSLIKPLFVQYFNEVEIKTEVYIINSASFTNYQIYLKSDRIKTLLAVIITLVTICGYYLVG